MTEETSNAKSHPGRHYVDAFLSFTCTLCVLVSSITLIGWFSKLPALVQWSSNSAPMHFNSAIIILGLGISLRGFKTRHWSAYAFLPCTLIAVATLYEIMTGVNLGFDELLVSDYITNISDAPGRLSPNSALCTVLLSLGLSTIIFHKKKLSWLIAATIFGSLCFAFGLTAALGYLSGVRGTYAWGSLTHMPIQSALLFTLLGKSCTLYAWQAIGLDHPSKRDSSLSSISWPLSLSIFSVATALSFSMLAEESSQSEISFLPFVSFSFGCITAILAGSFSHQWLEAKAREQDLRNTQADLIKEIEQRKKIQEQLRASKEAAQKANDAKTKFLAAVSHEIRNPLGAIEGFSNLVAQKDLEHDLRTRYCGIIARNSHMLLEYIDELLDIQRIESGQIEINEKEVDVRSLVNDVKDMLELQARKKNLTYKVHIDQSVPNTVYTDPKRAKQVLINIMSNALKYTEKGQVALAVKCKVSDQRQSLSFSLQDTGMGITEEFRTRIFQPYQRDNLEKASKVGGTGLGLEISRAIARKLGGDLTLVWSHLDEGSCFEFELPVSAAANGLQADELIGRRS